MSYTLVASKRLAGTKFGEKVNWVVSNEIPPRVGKVHKMNGVCLHESYEVWWGMFER